MRRDRTGEVIEDGDEHEDGGCPRKCRDGWLNDRMEAERPAPCLHCRPWLRRSRSNTGTGR